MTGDLYAEIAARYYEVHRDDPAPAADAEWGAAFALAALRARVRSLVSDGTPPEVIEAVLFRSWLRVAAWNHGVGEHRVASWMEDPRSLAADIVEVLERAAEEVVDDGPTAEMRALGLAFDEARAVAGGRPRPPRPRRRIAARRRKDAHDALARYLDECVVRQVHPAVVHGLQGRADIPGIPESAEFQSVFVLRNCSDAAMSVSGVVSVRALGRVGTFPVSVNLAPGQTVSRSLESLLGPRMARVPMSDVGLTVTHDGLPGHLVSYFVSADTSGEWVFTPPIKDPYSLMNQTGSYPWRCGAGVQTVVLVRNTEAKPTRFVVQIDYAAGSYTLPLQELGPFEERAIDVRALRDEQVPDSIERTIPPDTVSGRIRWFPSGPGVMVGRLEVYQDGRPVSSSFSCGGPGCPCAPSSVSIACSPPSLGGYVGASARMTVLETRQDACGTQFGPYDVTAATLFSSSNSSVASTGGVTSQGVLVNYNAPGTATITCTYNGAAYGPDPDTGTGCKFSPVALLTTCPVGVNPLVSVTGPGRVPLRAAGTSLGQNTITLTASPTPAGGSYAWSSSSSRVSLSGTTLQSVTVTSVSASAANNDVPIQVAYTVNGRTTVWSGIITVSRPASLGPLTDNTNPTGHSCTAGSGAGTCSGSYFVGSGSYSSYLRTRTYSIVDHLGATLGGYTLYFTETYSSPTGACAGSAVTTGMGLGSSISDCFWFCHANCQSGGSCAVSATQTIAVNGFSVGTFGVTWRCTGVTVQ